jgi:hypothetical protein
LRKGIETQQKRIKVKLLLSRNNNNSIKNKNINKHYIVLHMSEGKDKIKKRDGFEANQEKNGGRGFKGKK